MAALKGYCAECPCWFPIPDASLRANRLCPCCLQPATKVRRAGANMVRPRFTTRFLPWRRRPIEVPES